MDYGLLQMMRVVVVVLDNDSKLTFYIYLFFLEVNSILLLMDYKDLFAMVMD